MSMNIRRLNFHFQPNFNVETTLVHRRWVDVILSTLFQHFFLPNWNNVDRITSTQRRWTNVVSTLKFGFENGRWADVCSSTLFQRWNNVERIVSTLFCQRWNNVDKCTSAQLSFSTKYQRWNNVCWTLAIYVISTLIQRWCVCWVEFVTFVFKNVGDEILSQSSAMHYLLSAVNATVRPEH